jgi:tryptophanyl-tRNA synthetase
VRRTDPGDPAKCPVWQLHQVYSSQETLDWAAEGCRGANIGCLECKAPLIETTQAELAVFRDRAQPYIEDPSLVRDIITDGCEAARVVARETMEQVREAVGLGHR